MNDTYRDLIRAADVVSFDVFDTLLVRSIAHHWDAFRLAQELFNERSPWYLTDDLSSLRVEAEMRLRDRASAAGTSADAVTMDDIYSEIAATARLGAEMTAGLMEAELEAERLLLRPTPAVDLLRFAADHGKEVLVVSDTYLPRRFMVDLLAGAGIAEGCELWLSSEKGVSKADGSLWAALVARKPGRKIVHFGDNEVSDVIHARAFGLSTVHRPSPAESLRRGDGSAAALNGDWLFEHLRIDRHRLKNLHRSLVLGLVARRLSSHETCTPAYAVGYGAFGPLLLGFVQWLHRTATAQGNDHLYFLARDGRVMRDAYAAFWGDEALPRTYLLASRRLLNLPAIGTSLTNRDVDFLTQTSWPISVGEYFARLDLPEVMVEARRLLGAMGLDPSEPGTAHGAELRAVFWQMQDLLVAAATRERELLLGYWKQAGFLRGDRPAVVDIGWHGSLQRASDRVLEHAGITRKIDGLYFSLHEPRLRWTASGSMRAFVDAARAEDRLLYEQLITGSVAVLEFCFTQSEGTVIGIEEAAQADAQPGLEGDPRLLGRYADDRLGAEDSAILRELQDGAVDLVRDFREATSNMPGTVALIERDVAAESMVMLLSSPSQMAADVLGRRHHSDGFGRGVAWRLIGAPAEHPSSYEETARRLEGELANAPWRAGFVAAARGLGLTVN